MSQDSSPTPPFLAEHVSLAPDRGAGLTVTLARLPMSQATDLGLAFAAIEPWVKYPYPASALAAYFADGDHSAPRLAIRVGDQTAGVIGLRLNWLCGPYLQFLGLLPPFQAHGLGTLVLDWIDAETRRSGQRNIFVATSDFNASARRFYMRHGFLEVGSLKGLVRDDRDEILLHKKL